MFVCQSCGSVYPKWRGYCEGCSGWNTIAEEIPSPKQTKKSKSTLILSQLHDKSTPSIHKKQTHFSEFNRVCGGGLVSGSVLLIGGDPGIGKSTLLLQIMAKMSESYPCAYISGEESVHQIRLRAERLGLHKVPLYLSASTDIEALVETIRTGPEIFVIDSIQTMHSTHLESAPGSVSQVRLCAQALINVAKESQRIIFIIGHVTKDGTIAGPRILEHMVDAVLSFEGEPSYTFRLLRALKNRFGPTDEIGVFEMTDHGLLEVCDPSLLFLSGHYGDISGTTIFAGIEGTRPLLVEIQALTSSSLFGSPRRSVVGWDSARLSMLLAVLETRCGISFAHKDVYLNVVGGLRITEPAADLAVITALLSSLSDQPVMKDTVVFGEVGLSGEVRMVNRTEQRLKEALKLGFSQALSPPSRSNATIGTEIKHVSDLLPFFDHLAYKKKTYQKTF